MREKIAWILVVALLMGAYPIYKHGRQAMWSDMLQATGGSYDAQIQVLTPYREPLYHRAGTCIACHRG